MSVLIDSPEGKEAIRQAVEEATNALAAKNRELLTEVKEARKGRTIDPREIEERDAQIEELKTQVKTFEKTAKTATNEAATARKALETAESFTTRLLVDNGLNEALATAGVTNPVHLKAAKSMLSGQVQLVTDGDSKIVKVGEKDLKTYITEWAAGDEGKHFVAAPVNSGGGSQGSQSGAQSKTVSRSQFDSMTHADRSDFAKSGGKVTD